MPLFLSVPRDQQVPANSAFGFVGAFNKNVNKSVKGKKSGR